jgi:hypothetical protein
VWAALGCQNYAHDDLIAAGITLAIVAATPQLGSDSAA